MKKNDISKLKNRSEAELRKEAVEAKEKLWEIRREIAGGKIKNVKARNALRKDVARLLTIANEKALQTKAK